jgi:hypothetical protein
MLEYRFNFTQFNPKSPDFYLVVDSPYIVECPIGQSPRQITGSIEPLPGME